MKINTVKTIIVLGISLIIGLLCYSIADAEESRNIVAFATTSLSLFLTLGSAVACDYNYGNRNINIRTTAWIFTVIVLLANVIFSFLKFNVVTYPAIVLLMVLIAIGLVYSMCKPQENR